LSSKPEDKLQKKPYQQQTQAAEKNSRHPGSAIAFSDKGKTQRNKPHQ
jgi:hypothetical protein